MNTEKVVTLLNRAWEIIPFPFVLLYLVVLGMIFLLFEYSITYVGRATPGWRRPIPILPIISELVVIIIRSSSWLIWIWALLYFSFTLCIVLEEMVPDFTIPNGLLVIINTWQQGHNLINESVPTLLRQWLL